MNPQGIMPNNNGDLTNSFQGLTTDGKYYFVVIILANYPNLLSRLDSLPAEEQLNIPRIFKNNVIWQQAGARNRRMVFSPELAILETLLHSISIQRKKTPGS